MTTDSGETIFDQVARAESEVLSLRENVATTEQQLEDLTRLYAEAEQQLTDATQAQGEAHAIAGEFVLAARDDPAQAAVFVGDTSWRINHTQAAQAVDRANAAGLRWQQATVRAGKLGNAIRQLERYSLPAQREELAQKEAELERLQASASAAAEQARTWRQTITRVIRGG